jgi:chorismate-pyruvate lyase
MVAGAIAHGRRPRDRRRSIVVAVVTTEPISYTPFERMLLGTDGMVTHILEAYAKEPIEVSKLLQRIEPATAPDAAMELSEGDEVLRRQVVLRGRCSGRHLLYAEARIAVARMERAVVAALLDTDRPIGLLLAENRTESSREILRVGHGAAGPHATHFGIDEGAPMIWRTYRILVRRRPVILITERFPADWFRDLPA